MTVQELVSLSQKLNKLCQQAESDLAHAADSSSLVQELKQRLRAIEEATRFDNH